MLEAAARSSSSSNGSASSSASSSASLPPPRPAGHPDEGPLLVAPAPRRPAVLRKRGRKPSSSSKLAEDATQNLGGLHQLMRGRRDGDSALAPPEPVPRPGHTPRPSGSLSPIPAEPDEERMSTDSARPALGAQDLRSTAAEPTWRGVPCHAAHSNSRPRNTLATGPSSPGTQGYPPLATANGAVPASSSSLGARSRYVSGIDKLRNLTSPISRQTYLTNPLEKGLQGQGRHVSPPRQPSTLAVMDLDPDAPEPGRELADILYSGPGGPQNEGPADEWPRGLPPSRLLSKLERQAREREEREGSEVEKPDVYMATGDDG